MARMDDLLPELKDNISPSETKTASIIHTGKKRRAWLEAESTGAIDPVDKPLLRQTITSAKSFSKGSINRVYRPNLGFADLRSNPLQLFRYLFQLAQMAADDYKTPRVKIGDMMLNFNMSKDSARTALRFLLKQKFIERIDFQAGSMGWSRYQLNADVCKDLERGLSKGSIKPLGESGGKGGINPVVEDFIDPWEEIDFSPLDSIGFNRKHLLQIKNKTTPELVQESINHFAYGLTYNKKTKEYQNPVATLISVLKRGEFWVEPNYKSPQEIAQVKLLEMKKAELERKKTMEEEMYKVALDEWQQNLSKDDKELLDQDSRKRGGIMPPLVKLSAYFRENIWPEKKRDYLHE
jgi:hypothetical protein